MSGVNLLSSAARQRRAVASRVRRWAVTLGLVAGLHAAALVWMWGLWSLRGADPAPELTSLEARAELAKRELLSQAAKLRDLHGTRRAAQAVSDLPDWGLLLTLLSEEAGGRATLTSCTVAPAPAPGSTAPPAPGRVEHYTLVLQGVAPDPQVATDFAVDLERMGLFDRVTLAETARTLHQGREMVGFRLECAVSDLRGEAP